MNIKLITLTLFLFFSLGSKPHPVHVTVANIDFNKEIRAFDISLKIFTDDFEGILNKTYNVQLNLGSKNEYSGSGKYITDYIRNNFGLIVNEDKNHSKRLRFVRKEYNEGAVWLYFTYKLTQKINYLTIVNNLLNDYYPDMTNLVIIKVDKEERGYSMNKNNTTIKITS